MSKHEVFPFEYNGCDQADAAAFIFYNVTWTENWGPFKKDQTHEYIAVLFEEGVLETYNDNTGVPGDKIKFKGFPV